MDRTPNPDGGPTPPPAAIIDGVTVRYEARREGGRSFATHLRARKRDKRVVHALDDVSAVVPSGEVYAIIGRNGAGKTTLMRVIAGIIPPAEGRVELHSRVTPLLSMGIGFNRTLTGRENVLLGGLAAGLDLEFVRSVSQDVIDFAELGDAIDYPVRTYSAGMVSRLAFAVSAHIEPDLLLVDEALAAGDASFKERCTEKIAEMISDERTVILVSHGLSIVQAAARRCLWLDGGRRVAEGPVDEIIEGYLEREGVPPDAAVMEDM